MRIPNKYLSAQTVRIIEREAPTAVPVTQPEKPAPEPDGRLEALALENSMLRAQLATKPENKPVKWSFAIQRGADRLMTSVVATPIYKD